MKKKDIYGNKDSFFSRHPKSVSADRMFVAEKSVSDAEKHRILTHVQNYSVTLMVSSLTTCSPRCTKLAFEPTNVTVYVPASLYV